MNQRKGSQVEPMWKIRRDLERFTKIIKGQFRKDLRKYMASGELIAQMDTETVRVALPYIDIPKLVLGPTEEQVGIAKGEGESGEGSRPGNTKGEHPLEVEFSLSELAELLGDVLELPHIRPRARGTLEGLKSRYNSVSKQGPESLRHFRRTYRNALRRSIMSGSFDPTEPIIRPIQDDVRYRVASPKQSPCSMAAIIYMMDVSGSMGAEQKEIVRTQAFWIDTWLSHHYDRVDARFITHDASAREVDREQFFYSRESGGTLISSAYTLCAEIMERDYPFEDWNVYPMHFSDGDNWSQSDTELCVNLLRDTLVPRSNQFSYTQVDSKYGSGRFLKVLEEAFQKDEGLCLARVPSREDIPQAIQQILSGGR